MKVNAESEIALDKRFAAIKRANTHVGASLLERVVRIFVISIVIAKLIHFHNLANR